MKVQLPVVNHASGRNAGLIFQTYHGRTYARAMPALFHYPDTPAQQVVQGKFYNIFAQYRQIYRALQKIALTIRHRKTNYFDTFAKGIFQAAGTFDKEGKQEPPQFFGADKQQQVKIKTNSATIFVDSNVVKVSMDISIAFWRRRFVPNPYSVLLVNKTQQSLLMMSDRYRTNTIELEFTNTQDFQPSDTINVYLMLSNNEFLTNFYHIKL